VTSELAHIAQWVATATPDHGRVAYRRAKSSFIDTISCILGGYGQSVSCNARRFASERAEGPSTVVGGKPADPLWAAMCNGTAAHALDFDDYDSPSVSHIGSVLVPCILALGEELGSSGRSALDAFIVGYEVMVRLGETLNMAHYLRGWHATATIGALGAAAAAARMMNLDAVRTGHAVSLSTSMASGFKFQFGTMAKPLHAGLAAKAGLLSAYMAKTGMTASDAVFEGEHGLLSVWSGSGIPDLPIRTEKLGNPIAIEEYGLYVKKYPCCGYISRAIDGVLELRSQEGFTPERIESIAISIPQPNVLILPFERPIDAMQARFSMHYCVAVAAVTGRLTMADFRDSALNRENILPVQHKVTMTGFEVASDARDCSPTEPDTVEIRLASGRRLRSVIGEALGSPGRPLSDTDVYDKYISCAGEALPKRQMDALWKELGALERLSSINDLMHGLRSVRLVN
jgi:2-methylcitrate dehydratase PrpD